jgi:hypothetical protein
MSEEVRGLTENKRPNDDAKVGEVGRPEPGLWGLLLATSDAPPFLGWPAHDPSTLFSLRPYRLTTCKTYPIWKGTPRGPSCEGAVLLCQVPSDTSKLHNDSHQKPVQPRSSNANSGFLAGTLCSHKGSYLTSFLLENEKYCSFPITCQVNPEKFRKVWGLIRKFQTNSS